MDSSTVKTCYGEVGESECSRGVKGRSGDIYTRLAEALIQNDLQKCYEVSVKKIILGNDYWPERTPGHEAASLGQVEKLQLLVDSGASVNAATIDNMTPLHEACMQDHPECVRVLLNAGAQVDIRTIHGSTPLCHACAAGSVESARLLLDHGASVNPSLTALTASPLHEACIQGNPECVKLILSKGALLEAFDIHFGTPLHIACAKSQLECALQLLNAGARVNAAKFHETALHHAARVDYTDLIELLVEFGGDINVRDNLGRKPIDYANPGSASHVCLQHYESCPLSLQQLSRITLRRVLGTRALQVITQLNISQRLIGYLCYKNYSCTTLM